MALIHAAHEVRLCVAEAKMAMVHAAHEVRLCMAEARMAVVHAAHEVRLCVDTVFLNLLLPHGSRFKRLPFAPQRNR